MSDEGQEYINELYVTALLERCADHPDTQEFNEGTLYDIIDKIIESAAEQDRTDDLFDYDFDPDGGSTIYVDSETFETFLEDVLEENDYEI